MGARGRGIKKKPKLLIEKLFVSICLWEEAEKNESVFFGCGVCAHLEAGGDIYSEAQTK